MKIGRICKSMDKPTEGFSFKREGYKIYISYIDPKNIVESDSNDINKYQYREYTYCGAISSYEDLVNKCIKLKYSIEEELSLFAKAIIDKDDQQYVEYRSFVSLCKNECMANYTNLGLIREEE